MNKKGQGMSITTIIIAAIALIIMVVLIAIFTGKMGTFTQKSDSAAETATGNVCSARVAGSYCLSSGTCADGYASETYPGGWVDCGQKTCCIKQAS